MQETVSGQHEVSFCLYCHRTWTHLFLCWQVEELNVELDTIRKNKAALDKAKANLESENAELDHELKQMSTARNDSERKRKQLENQMLDLQARYSETDRTKSDLLEKSNALQVGSCVTL